MSDALVAPTKVVVVDAAGPFPEIVPGEYERARVIVWHHDRLAGHVDIEIGAGMSPADLAEVVGSLASGPRPGTSTSSPILRSDATVIIATHDRPGSLLRCLDSLRADIEAGASVIVVDSAPSDQRALEALRAWPNASGHVTYVRVERPGLAVAHNVALGLVDSEFVLFTDDDVIVDQRWVSATLAAFADHPHAACVTGSILPAELDTETQCLIEQSAGFDKGRERRVFDLGAHRPDDPLFPFTAGSMGSGANMSFRTRVLREVGGFDAALGAGSKGVGGDDLASFIDVVVAGHQVVYEPAAAVQHHHHREFAALRRQARGYGTGLTAAIVSSVARHPSLLIGLLRRVPRALWYAVADSSPKNARRPDSYPKELGRLELLGMATGPFAYVHSRIVGRAGVEHDAPVVLASRSH